MKLAPDSAGHGASRSWTAWCAVAGWQEERESTLAVCHPGWLGALLMSLLTPLPLVMSLRSPCQQICKPSTLLTSTESKYSNLEFSLFKNKCDFNLPTSVLSSVWHFFLWHLLRKKKDKCVSGSGRAGEGTLPSPTPKFFGFPQKSGSPRHPLVLQFPRMSF